MTSAAPAASTATDTDAIHLANIVGSNPKKRSLAQQRLHALEVLLLVAAPKTFEHFAHDSVAIDEHHHGHLRDVIEPADLAAGVVQHGVAGAGRHLARLPRALIEAHGEQLDAGILVAVAHCAELGELGAAVSAPRRPEAQHHDLAAVFRQAQVLAGEAPQHEVGRCCALELGRRGHGAGCGEQPDERRTAPQRSHPFSHAESSRTSSERRRKPYSDAALRVYEPGLSPLAQGLCGIQSTERATSHKRAETRAVARFRIMRPADETRELSARGYSRATCASRKAAKPARGRVA